MNVHRILSRAAWCLRTGGRIMLGLLIVAFVTRGPIVPALDDLIEHRCGKRIAAKGIYLDPVRSSDSQVVKASGLRWMSLMAADPDPLGGAHLGAAVPYRTRAVRTRLPGARPPAQALARRWAATRPSRRGAGFAGATSYWLATAASPPCCSSTRCAVPASRRLPDCGPL